MKQRGYVLVMTIGLLAGSRARGQVAPDEPVGNQARALLAHGQGAQAIPLFKRAIERNPMSETLRLLLARAYLDDGNDFWALRTIAAAAELHRESCSLPPSLLTSADLYPRSAGYFDSAAYTTNRRDILLKVSASAFLPPLIDQLKVGVFYELSSRDSTAHPYAYTDHRLLCRLIWTFTADPWLPAAASPFEHVALDYGLGGGELGERVQDLLRQGEDVQRSAACRD